MGEALRDLGIQQAVSADELVAHTLAKGLEAPHAGDLILQLVDSEQHSLQEISADHALVGRALSSVRTGRSGLVLGLVHQGRVIMGIGDDPVIADGAHLLVAEPGHGRRAPAPWPGVVDFRCYHDGLRTRLRPVMTSAAACRRRL